MQYFFDESQIYRFWDVFKLGNQLTEIRLLTSSDNRNASGYFTDPKKMIDAVKGYSNEYNVYFTINSINPDCYGRPQRDKIINRSGNTTTDKDIIGRDWIILDLDSKRATGVNATEEQLTAAKLKANDVYKFLTNNGFYPPVVICSGSGVHLYLRCALLPSDENSAMVKRFLKAMSMMFTDDKVDIDTTVHNLSRISRVPGFFNRKGSSEDSERPQRLCSFVKIPEEIKINEKEYFEKIASLYPEEEIKPTEYNNYSTEPFDLESFIAKHNIPVVGKRQVADGTRYYLTHCLFNEQHKGKDAILFRHKNGAVAYFCYHNSCAGNNWHKLREMYEPDAYKKKAFQYNIRPRDKENKVFVPKEENTEQGKKWLNMSDIKRVNIEDLLAIPTGYELLDKKIIGLFAGELSILSGLSASGKTSWLGCLSLNIVNQGFKVAMWSGEMQDWRYQNWINQIAAGKTYVVKKDGYDNLYYTPNQYCKKIEEWLHDKLFLYNNNYGNKWQQLFEDIKELVEKKQVQMIILDNLAALEIDNYGGEKYSQQSKFVLEIKDYAKQKNIHVIIVCHPRKEMGFLRKESISGTADLTNICDNLFLLHRVGKDFSMRAGDFFGKDKVEEFMNYNNVLEVAKNRQMGVVDYLVGMYYESESRRLKNSIAEHIHYGWEDCKEEELSTMPIPNNEFRSSLEDFVMGDEDNPLADPVFDNIAPF